MILENETMTKILLSGCLGAMGRVISERVSERDDAEIAAGLDIREDTSRSYPIYTDLNDVELDCDVVIDFSHPNALDSVLAFALRNKLPAVIATTGLSEEQVAKIHEASNSIPVFFSANMSLGINLIAELCKKAASVLGDDFDIEIVEAHHNKKVDAPSGTAYLLEREVEAGLSYEPVLEYDRHAKRERRSKHEIGMHAIRGGTIVGEHSVIFAGNDEVITISHSARSKAVFATGAVNAALFLVGKAPGLYSMKDMLK